MQFGEDLAVTVTSDADPVVIVAVGEMDAFTRSRLVGAIARALSRNVGRVVVDVSGLTFIDATSYSALVELTGKARSEGAALVFRNPTRTFLRARELVDKDRALEVEQPG